MITSKEIFNYFVDNGDKICSCVSGKGSVSYYGYKIDNYMAYLDEHVKDDFRLAININNKIIFFYYEDKTGIDDIEDLFRFFKIIEEVK